MKKAALITFLSIIVLTAGALIAVAIFLPAKAAYVCPSCYGLKRVAQEVHIERTATEAKRIAFLESLAAAEARVAEFYSERKAKRPMLLACMSKACDQRLGGKGAKARAYGASFIHVSPNGWNPTILSHELAHIELHARIGTSALVTGALPAWFDEGLAVIVSRDKRYLEAGVDGEMHCTVSQIDPLPDTKSGWGQEAGSGERPIYAMAACKVLNWLEAHGGPTAVGKLANHIRQGKAFYE